MRIAASSRAQPKTRTCRGRATEGAIELEIPVKSTVATSAMPIGMPGCPELAAWTLSITNARIALAISRSETVSVFGVSCKRSLSYSSSSPHEARFLRSINCMISGVRISCMARSSLSAGDDDRIGPRMKQSVDHRQQIGEFDPARPGETDHHIDFVRCRDPPCNDGFDVSTIGTRWKLMSVSVNCGVM